MPSPTRRKPAAAAKPKRPPFEIGGLSIPAGTRRTLDLPMSLLSNHTPLSVPVHVIHGRRDGPRLFVSAAVHGDELNGVEIIRRLMRHSEVSRLRGTLIAVPIVNVFGFIGHTRYLPDRRDLNRCFPGSPDGSLAAQLADLFMREIVSRCTHGIDLHTGSIHRTNFPQIRAALSDPRVMEMARAFSAPIIIDAAQRDGSLRKAALERDVPTIVYEAGEALRFDEVSIRGGVRGILGVMRLLDMVRKDGASRTKFRPALASSSYWVRAPAGGIIRALVPEGSRVEPDHRLGLIANPFGQDEIEVTAGDPGILIGRTKLPIVNQGDGLFHIARVVDAERAERTVETFHDELDGVERKELETL